MKKNIALVTGGFSGEAVISYKSAITIDKNLDREKFNVYKIDISPEGWYYETENGKIEIDKNDFSLATGNRKIYLMLFLLACTERQARMGSCRDILIHLKFLTPAAMRQLQL